MNLLLLICSSIVPRVSSAISGHVMLHNQTHQFPCDEDWFSYCNNNATTGDVVATSQQHFRINSMCAWHPCAKSSQLIRRGQVCDGTFDCVDLSDECMCDDSVLRNLQTYKICSHIFHQSPICTSLHSSKNIDIANICDDVTDCKNGEDELFCQRMCKYGRKRENKFHECRRNGQIIKLNWRHKFDGIQDCDDFSDEWHDSLPFCNSDFNLSYACAFHGQGSHCVGPLRKYSDKKILSTPEKYNSSIFFRVMTWVLSYGAFLSNFALLLHLIIPKKSENGIIISRRMNGNNRLRMINNILVISLCFSDLITGLQGIMWTYSAAQFTNNFWDSYEGYITSWSCLTTGFISMLGTHASLYTIVVIASVRLYTVLCPFKAAENLRFFRIAVALSCAWLVGIVFSTLPLITTLHNSFISSVGIAPVANLEATVVERHTIENMVRILALLYNNHSNSQSFIDCNTLRRKTWEELESFMNGITHQRPWKYNGYYSQTPPCVPPIIVSANEPGWIYSLSILVLDFIAYIYVVVAYVIVYTRTTGSNLSFYGHSETICKTSKPAVQKDHCKSRRLESLTNIKLEEDHQMQKRIFILISTDFVCWIPVCTLTMLNVVSDAYNFKTKATFIFSILMIQANSLVNPIIYSKRVRDRIINICVTNFMNLISRRGRMNDN